MKLLSTDHSPFAARVRMAALAKGLDLPEEMPPEGPGSPAFQALSPLGMVPALVTDAGAVLPESETIVEYLEDLHPQPSLRPPDPLTRARARLLARIADLYLAEPLRELFEHAKAGDAGTEPMKAAAVRVRTALRHLDHFIGGHGFAVGGQLSTADCALVPLLFFVARCTPMFERSDGQAPWHGVQRLHAYWVAIQQAPVAAQVVREMEAAQQRRAQERALHGRNAVR
ncbi:MAG TPA: glutathione S-transferase family protein [Ramlibacter sp.]|nr:glutathione S-transferase family protein [Ramlibacter sp.]